MNDANARGESISAPEGEASELPTVTRLSTNPSMAAALPVHSGQITAEHRNTLVMLEGHQQMLRALSLQLEVEREQRSRAELAEAALIETLAFKEAVIHEADHRVKNTIQIAASLLSLQSRTTATPEAGRALLAAHGRLLLLAKVHERLYMSSSSRREIPMPALFTTISRTLAESFGELSPNVTLTIDAEPLLLSPDDAIPMGLLVNEALTNAYKHAFPDDRHGRIDIDLHKLRSGRLMVVISDNGVGAPAGINPHGMGLSLMRSIAIQLKGELELGSPAGGTGTIVRLTIQRDTRRVRRLKTAPAAPDA